MISLCSRVKSEFEPISPSLGGTGRKAVVEQYIFKVNLATAFPEQGGR